MFLLGEAVPLEEGQELLLLLILLFPEELKHLVVEDFHHSILAVSQSLCLFHEPLSYFALQWLYLQLEVLAYFFWVVAVDDFLRSDDVFPASAENQEQELYVEAIFSVQQLFLLYWDNN